MCELSSCFRFRNVRLLLTRDFGVCRTCKVLRCRMLKRVGPGQVWSVSLPMTEFTSTEGVDWRPVVVPSTLLFWQPASLLSVGRAKPGSRNVLSSVNTSVHLLAQVRDHHASAGVGQHPVRLPSKGSERGQSTHKNKRVTSGTLRNSR